MEANVHLSQTSPRNLTASQIKTITDTSKFSNPLASYPDCVYEAPSSHPLHFGGLNFTHHLQLNRPQVVARQILTDRDLHFIFKNSPHQAGSTHRRHFETHEQQHQVRHVQDSAPCQDYTPQVQHKGPQRPRLAEYLSQLQLRRLYDRSPTHYSQQPC